jgi:hypothetical protein
MRTPRQRLEQPISYSVRRRIRPPPEPGEIGEFRRFRYP